MDKFVGMCEHSHKLILPSIHFIGRPTDPHVCYASA